MSNLIFLMGVRGCGKSSLGLMVSVLLNFTYIDLEQSMATFTGQPDSIYLQTHTIEEYRHLQFKLIHKSITEVQERYERLSKGGLPPDPDADLGFTIFILPAVCVENPQLMEYFTKEDFPYIVNVEREETKILEYLRYKYSYKQGTAIIRENFAKYRLCSKFTFFNFHSDCSYMEICFITARNHRQQYKTLGLKATERDFTYFIMQIIKVTRSGTIYVPNHLWELRNKYTSALELEIPSPYFMDIIYNVGDAIAGSDCIDLHVNLIELIKMGVENMESHLHRFVATIRRYSYSQRLILSVKNSLEELDTFLTEYLKIVGLAYELNEDLVVFYLNFLNSAKRLAIPYVALNLAICAPKSHVSQHSSANSSIPTSTSATTLHSASPHSDHIYADAYNIDSKRSSHHNGSPSTVSSLNDTESPSNNKTNFSNSSYTQRTVNNINDIIIDDDETSTNSPLSLVKGFIKRCESSTTVIGKYHSEEENFWESTSITGATKMADFAVSLGLQIIRLTKTAVTLDDNLTDANFSKNIRIKYPHILISAYNTGVLGRVSKLFNRVLTPVNMDLQLIASNSLKMGHDDKLKNIDIIKSLHRAYYIAELSFLFCGLESKSYFFHNAQNLAFAKLGYQHKCSYFDSNDAKLLKELIQMTPSFGGARLLQPLSNDGHQFADYITEHARIIGACNALFAERNMSTHTKILKIRGDNLEWRVFTVMARRALSPVNYASKRRSVFVLGSNECTTRSAIYAMIKLGFTNIMIFDPNYNSSVKLADHYNLQSSLKLAGEQRYFNVVPLTEHDVFNGILPPGFDYPTIIINGSPLVDSKFGNTVAIDLPTVWFSSDSGGAVLETTLDPLETPLIKKCADLIPRGWVNVTGLNYELITAQLFFEYFTGKPTPFSYFKKIAIENYVYTRTNINFDLH